MRVVWKFPMLQRSGRLGVEMPKGAELLTVLLQPTRSAAGSPSMLWALCDPEAPREVRVIESVETGIVSVDLDGAMYIGSVSTATGLVWHYFDRGPA